MIQTTKVNEPKSNEGELIASVKKKHVCVDLFAGCGGLSLGLESAGFHPLLFSELNFHAAETYMANRVYGDTIPVGDIYNFTDPDIRLLKAFWEMRGIKEIDLVCGGPPCQGFSGIGHRRSFKLAKEEIPSNHLFEEMVRVIRAIRPKVFLFENVKGLLTSRWNPEGQTGELFHAVVEAFKTLKDYEIQWDLLHAKDYGVPQNRPRVIMIGIRKDILPAAISRKLVPIDSTKPNGRACGFLPMGSGKAPDLVDLLSDLEDPAYLEKSATLAYTSDPKNDIQRAMRLKPDGHLLKKGDPLTEHEYSNHAPYIREKFAQMIANGGEIPEQFKTKKFAQRVFPKKWGESGPNITATSLPEDYVHYRQARGPTVREWARLQTFPDWYQFRGPRTTGGRRRAGDPSKGIWDRDVPRYTQIGNAVPVLLAQKIGEHLSAILEGGK
jgi:DNA (cytosine-5)-methyltransferase 1